jgi:hypothetical protein
MSLAWEQQCKQKQCDLHLSPGINYCTVIKIKLQLTAAIVAKKEGSATVFAIWWRNLLTMLACQLWGSSLPMDCQQEPSNQHLNKYLMGRITA